LKLKANDAIAEWREGNKNSALDLINEIVGRKTKS
jgi:hypothetical protein